VDFQIRLVSFGSYFDDPNPSNQCTEVVFETPLAHFKRRGSTYVVL
jgi:hypothetical protein